MTKFYFTRLYAFAYRAFISKFCLPSDFTSVLSFMLCGQIVYVSKFPFLVLDYSEPPGWYFVESVIYCYNGDLLIGLELEAGKVEYYSFSDIDITKIGIDSSVH